MKLNIHVKTTLAVAEATPTLLQIEAAQVGEAQTVEESILTITPFAEAEPFGDFYGNPCRRLLMPAGDVEMGHSGVPLWMPKSLQYWKQLGDS